MTGEIDGERGPAGSRNDTRQPVVEPFPKTSKLDALRGAPPAELAEFGAQSRGDMATDGRFRFALHQPGSVREVRLLHGLAGHRHPPQFTQCHDEWFIIEFNAPAVRRMEYRLEVIDVDGNSRSIVDPRNPHRTTNPFGENSVAMAEGYAEPRHAGPSRADAIGTLRSFIVPGLHDQAWPAWVWEPPGAATREVLPLILFLDGGDYLRLAGMQRSLENLVAEAHLSRCRAVFVSPLHRNDEYSANPRMPAHFVERVGPAVAAQVPWPDEPAMRLGVGASLGGLCLLHAQIEQPGMLGGLVLQSGSYFRRDIDAMESQFRHFDRITSFVDQLDAMDLSGCALPVRMTCGRGGENLANNQRMAALLARKKWDVQLNQWPDAHNWIGWRDCIAGALIDLLPGAAADAWR